MCAICSHAYPIFPDIDNRQSKQYMKALLIEPTHPFALPNGQLGRSDYQLTEFHNHTTEGMSYAVSAVKC